jgi:hypothetical protein
MRREARIKIEHWFEVSLALAAKTHHRAKGAKLKEIASAQFLRHHLIRQPRPAGSDSSKPTTALATYSFHRRSSPARAWPGAGDRVKLHLVALFQPGKEGKPQARVVELV